MLSQTSYPCRAWYPTGVIGEFGGAGVGTGWGSSGSAMMRRSRAAKSLQLQMAALVAVRRVGALTSIVPRSTRARWLTRH